MSCFDMRFFIFNQINKTGASRLSKRKLNGGKSLILKVFFKTTVALLPMVTYKIFVPLTALTTW